MLTNIFLKKQLETKTPPIDNNIARTQMGPLVLIGSSGLVIGGVGSLQKFCRSVGFYRYTVYTYRKALNDSLTN